MLGNKPDYYSNLAISGSFIIYDDTRDIHPFIWTQYTNLGNPPAVGASISIYKQNVDASFDRIMSLDTVQSYRQ